MLGSAMSGDHCLRTFRSYLLLAVTMNIGAVYGTPAIRSAPQATIVNAGVLGGQIKEYEVGHMIGSKEAAEAFDAMVEDLINKPTPAWCPTCNQTIASYCLNRRVLADHCCCDSGHARDQLPWLPHTCHDDDTCQPIMGSCMYYTELRECCCDRIMAKQWRNIRSAASSIHLLSIASAVAASFAVLASLSCRGCWS